MAGARRRLWMGRGVRDPEKGLEGVEIVGHVPHAPGPGGALGEEASVTSSGTGLPHLQGAEGQEGHSVRGKLADVLGSHAHHRHKTWPKEG